VVLKLISNQVYFFAQTTDANIADIYVYHIIAQEHTDTIICVLHIVLFGLCTGEYTQSASFVIITIIMGIIC